MPRDVSETITVKRVKNKFLLEGEFDRGILCHRRRHKFEFRNGQLVRVGHPGKHNDPAIAEAMLSTGQMPPCYLVVIDKPPKKNPGNGRLRYNVVSEVMAVARNAKAQALPRYARYREKMRPITDRLSDRGVDDFRARVREWRSGKHRNHLYVYSSPHGNESCHLRVDDQIVLLCDGLSHGWNVSLIPKHLGRIRLLGLRKRNQPQEIKQDYEPLCVVSRASNGSIETVVTAGLINPMTREPRVAHEDIGFQFLARFGVFGRKVGTKTWTLLRVSETYRDHQLAFERKPR